MAVRVQQSFHLVVQQQDLDAAYRLLQRIYTPEEKSLPMMVFGTITHPIPTCFADQKDPFSMEMVGMINETMVAATTYTIVAEWKFSPEQVDNLAPKDQRITALRQKLSAEIAKLPLVAELNRNRLEIILKGKN